MSPNLNNPFRNGNTQCNIIPIIVTLIVFDLVYSKFSEQCQKPNLSIVTTSFGFIKKLQKFQPYPFPAYSLMIPRTFQALKSNVEILRKVEKLILFNLQPLLPMEGSQQVLQLQKLNLAAGRIRTLTDVFVSIVLTTRFISGDTY